MTLRSIVDDFPAAFACNWSTLESGIVVLVGIIVLVGTFARINKHTGGNKNTGVPFF